MFWVEYLNFRGIRRAEVGEKQEGGRRMEDEREGNLSFILKKNVTTVLYLHSKTCTTSCGNTVFHYGHASEVTLI